LCLSSSSALHFFPIILFGSTTLLTGMTGNSLHMQWPLTSQSHGDVSQREQLVFRYGSNSTPKVLYFMELILLLQMKKKFTKIYIVTVI
jgi:hypothetical protein